ncbi:MAG: RRXRR domain-containing protein [Anaerolineaceae bacterium]|nr:RRXRR domain-containing protein [Anaerolineaceae bacterium]
MYRVYVQNKDGTPLDPTTRFGWVRRALKSGKAVVKQRKPFVIRLTYQIDNPVTKTYIGGTDPGRTNIGNAVLREEDTCVIYTDHVETRNGDIPKLMENRRGARSASRRGERLKRKRLAKRHGTLSSKLAAEGGRMIPGCEKRIAVKDIINTEARFSNRKRHSNVSDVVKNCSAWVTPSVKQLVQTHLNQVDNIRKLLPVKSWCLEMNKFAFMRMEDGTVRGVDFQNGRMKGYKSVDDYVYALQNGKCACCGKPMDDVHHIIPRSKGGSDGPDNRIGLCDECHHKVHTGELDLEKVGMSQKYGALSVLNQAVPFIYQGLVERFGEDNVFIC